MKQRHWTSLGSMLVALVLSLAALVLSAVPARDAGAQELLRLDGRVQWIAGPKMLVLPRAGGQPVNIDLTRVPQDQYATLKDGNLVRIDGLRSTDGRRMIAASVLARWCRVCCRWRRSVVRPSLAAVKAVCSGSTLLSTFLRLAAIRARLARAPFKK